MVAPVTNYTPQTQGLAQEKHPKTSTQRWDSAPGKSLESLSYFCWCLHQLNQHALA